LEEGATDGVKVDFDGGNTGRSGNGSPNTGGGGNSGSPNSGSPESGGTRKQP
jgi:hypothetical protein